jgi:hypothetical protein
MNLTCTCDPCLVIHIKLMNLIETRLFMMSYMSCTPLCVVLFVPGISHLGRAARGHEDGMPMNPTLMKQTCAVQLQ